MYFRKNWIKFQSLSYEHVEEEISHLRVIMHSLRYCINFLFYRISRLSDLCFQLSGRAISLW